MFPRAHGSTEQHLHKYTTEIKLPILCNLIRRYDPHIIGAIEVGWNWKRYKASDWLALMVSDLQRESRSYAAYNEHESEYPFGRYQPGGTGMIILDELIPYSKRGFSDLRKLGRWTSYTIEGKKGHKTRVFVVYNVGGNTSHHTGSYYQQVLQHIQLHDLQTTPRKLFEADFLHRLRQRRKAGKRLIVMMDANEHAITGRMCRRLGQDGIELVNTTQAIHGKQPEKTFAKGQRPIDGIWHTPDVEMTHIKWVPFTESPGDHMACIFEFTTLSVMGQNEQRIVYPPCRRLNTKITNVAERYGEEVEQQFPIHHIVARLDALELSMGHAYPASSENIEKLEGLDCQVVEIQRHCEKECRKIRWGDLPFSKKTSCGMSKYRCTQSYSVKTRGRSITWATSAA